MNTSMPEMVNFITDHCVLYLYHLRHLLGEDAKELHVTRDTASLITASVHGQSGNHEQQVTQ